LTDGAYTILTLLRIVDAGEDVHMAVKEMYNIASVQKNTGEVDAEHLATALANSDDQETLKKAVTRIMDSTPLLAVI
jgi:hypothetical protein